MRGGADSDGFDGMNLGTVPAARFTEGKWLAG